MKTLRRGILLLVALVLSLRPSATAALSFHDTDPDAWYYADLQRVVSARVVSGYEDGSFRPDAPILVGELLKMLYINFGLQAPEAEPGAHWASGYALAAQQAGFLEADEPLDLDAEASRLLVGELLLAAMGLKPVLDAENPFIDTMNEAALTLNHYGIVRGTVVEKGWVYRPYNAITRAELCALLNRANDFFSLENAAIAPLRYAPEWAAPLGPSEVSLSYFESVFKHMIANDIIELEIAFEGYTMLDFYNIGVFDNFVTPAFRKVFDEEQEIAVFYPDVHYYTYQPRGGNHTVLRLTLDNPDFPGQEALLRKVAFVSEAEAFVAQLFEEEALQADMSEREMAFAIYKAIALRFEYDFDLKDPSYDGYGLFENGEGVCQAYVALFNLMCEIVGIEAIGVGGHVRGGAHIWSHIYIDGYWTYVDPTFGDPEGGQSDYYDPSWFGLSLGEILGTHLFDPPHFS